MTAALTSAGIGYDRAGPRSELPVVLIHAGIADRRMWDPQWPGLTAEHDAIRVDLTGFGDSGTRPDQLDRVAEVLATLTELGVDRCRLIGASYGVGIAVELALTQPGLVASLLLSAPGGSLMTTLTPDLRAFFEAERAALAGGDLAAAVEANLIAWVDGHGRTEPVDPAVRRAVGVMQRRAFEIQADWDDLTEAELDPPAVERLAELAMPTTIVVGGRDLQAIQRTAATLSDGITGARRIDWPDVAHLPSMEHPEDFLALIQQQLA